MFGTFRKHSTWLWGLIIAAMAVSLVYWTGNRGTGNGGGNFNLGTIGGQSVTKEDLQSAAAEARLHYYNTRGEWPGNDAARMGFDLNKEAYRRLFLIQKEEEFGIHVGAEQVAKVVANDLRALSARNGSTVTVQMFEQSFLKPQGLTLVDYERFLRHQLGLQQLVSAVTVGGRMVTEKEARAVFERENRERSVQAVFFNASNYLSKINLTMDGLTAFYSNYVASYRLPERIQVQYVEFKATNHWAEAGADLASMTNHASVAEVVKKYGLQPQLATLTDLPAILDAIYGSRGGTNYYNDTTPEKAKEGIREELHMTLALRAAAKVANAFADPILSAKVIRAEALAERAKEQGVELKESAPFDQNSAPAGMNVSGPFVKAAFGVHEDEPVGGPVVDGDAIYLLAQSKVIPSRIQSFEEVKDKVADDYQRTEALKAARTAAEEFVAKATNAVAEGRAFTSMCTEAKVTPVLLPPFSLNTRTLDEIEQRMSLQQFKQIAFNIPVGQVSPAVPIVTGAMAAYIQSELPLDENKVTEELPGFLKMFRQARQQEAFDEWLAREEKVALANTPVAGPSPSELNQPGVEN